MDVAALTPDRGHAPPGSRPLWPAVVTLFALMVVGHLDRQIVVSMFPLLRAHWSLGDAELGWLVSIVSLMVALWAVPLAFLADRTGHVRAIAAMALLWCGATVACAFMRDYAALMTMRALVGVGQAAFGAVGAAVLASRFPERGRSTILGAFLAAGLAGNAIGVFLGGVLAAQWGWEMAFVLAGLPGFVLVAVLLGLERSARERTDVVVRQRAAEPWLAHLRSLAHVRTVPLVCIGAGLQLFTVASLAAWLPTYLHRMQGLDVAEAGSSGSLVLFAGVGGAVMWSAACDRWSLRRPVMRVALPAVLAATTGLLAVATFAAIPPGDIQFAAMLAIGAVMTGYIGPCAAVVADVVHPAIRATAIALLALSQNLLGLALGPVMTGLLSDAYGLAVALAIVPLASLGAAVAFALASRTYAADRIRDAAQCAHERDDAASARTASA